MCKAVGLRFQYVSSPQSNNSKTDTTTNNDIAIFTNEEFGNVRAVTVNGEPYFVGKDVATILGYAKQNLMFIKRKKNRSGTVSVVVAEKISGRYRELVTIGIARSPEEIDTLVAEGL